MATEMSNGLPGSPLLSGEGDDVPQFTEENLKKVLIVNIDSKSIRLVMYVCMVKERSHGHQEITARQGKTALVL